MTGNKILKALYIFALIGFVVVMFNQGKEGGELVYEHGLNVQAVKTLDDKIFDLEEALEDAKVAIPTVEAKTEVPAAEAPVVVTPQAVPSQVAQPVVQEPSVQTPQTPIETAGIKEAVETVVTPTQVSAQTGEAVEKTVATPTAETIPTPQ